MFAADGGDAGRRARNGIYVKAALSCARAAEAVRAEGLIPSTERDAVRYLSDLIFDGNGVYKADPGWGVKWTESWLRRKYGGEALDALTRQAAERLALLPEGAREAAKPGILSETFGPLAEHLMVKGNEAAADNEPSRWGSELKPGDQWTAGEPDDIINSQMTEGSVGGSLISLSRSYVNRADQLYKNLSNVKPIDGFEDFGIHGAPDMSKVIYVTTNGVETTYDGTELAEIIRSDPSYKGGNVRLLSCGAGSELSKVAQDCANGLNRSVLAPTETLWLAENGETFISNSSELASMWFNGGNVDCSFRPTGVWKEFKPVE